MVKSIDLIIFMSFLCLLYFHCLCAGANGDPGSRGSMGIKGQEGAPGNPVVYKQFSFNF